MGAILIILGVFAMGAPFGLSSHDLSSTGGFGDGVTLDALNIKTNITIIGAALFVAGIVVLKADELARAARPEAQPAKE